MNRLLIDKESKVVKNKKDNTIELDIKEDTNFLITKDDFKKYVFNIYDAKVNIFINNENFKEQEYEINVYKGSISFNNFCMDPNNTHINVNLNKEESSAFIYNSVLANNYAQYKINVFHNKNNTVSNVYNNGVTKNDGSIIFDVSSKVPKMVKNTEVNQDSKIIALNDTNKNKINPVLLIDNYETKASHAAFVGNFNNKELFYLMTRGLKERDAKKLLLNGLLVGVLDICFNEKEELKKKIISL